MRVFNKRMSMSMFVHTVWCRYLFRVCDDSMHGVRDNGCGRAQSASSLTGRAHNASRRELPSFIRMGDNA